VKKSVWLRILGVKRTVLEGLDVDEATGSLLARVRPVHFEQKRCGQCRRRCPSYDHGEGRRRWRGLDLGTVQVYLEAASPRVRCPIHGVVVAAVPWARHGARFTRDFEDTTAWLAASAAASVVSELMRISWRSVGRLVERVVDEATSRTNPLEGLRRIGIDEVSYRKGHKYLTVVVNHDTGRLVWAATGRDEKTLRTFFDRLGEAGCRSIEQVSADAASWIAKVVRDRCPSARLCLDPFHVVAWATDALDTVRRNVWNTARRAGQHALARDLKGARFALWKNPNDLTPRQQSRLAQIEKTNRPLYRAYLLKEQLREVFQLKGEPGIELLGKWLAWASRSKLPAFVKVARTIRAHRAAIEDTLRLGLSNARVEATNTTIRLITRRAYGFHSPDALIALAMLRLGGLRPALPGRSSSDRAT
jgi:transposase